ncbi:MAG: Tab2 family RNA-binding protein [Nodosilinea sp.]
MILWQADLHRPPLLSPSGEPLWELLLCSADFSFSYGATCPQSRVTPAWVMAQVKTASQRAGVIPDKIYVFRPQALSLVSLAGQHLAILVEPSRQVNALKQWLEQRAAWYATLDNYSGASYNPLQLEAPPPLPLPEHLWGDRWRFAGLAAGDFEQTLPHEPIPIRHLPPQLMPARLGLSSTTSIPGLVIDAGRQAMPLCQWLQTVQPQWLTYVAGQPDGLILEAGLVDRWIITTFSDADVSRAGQLFGQRQHHSQGLHFLLVRPDDSGVTYTGLWLLQLPHQ